MSAPARRLGHHVLVERLGAGAYGVVHRAVDSRTGAELALKRLERTEPRALLRFKREFRTLADVVHPNLVTLYELGCEDDEWFFTMELVDGVPLLEWVCGTSAVDESGDVLATSVRHERARSALVQLAEALDALHVHNVLHRDLKPSNVLVTRDGRLVVLDFGLATDSHATASRGSFDLVGSPAYMAPEQASGVPIGPAADWYAVGVMLFQMLTGELPITGHALQIVVRKQLEDAPDPVTLAPDAPEDLLGLCRALLVREPAARAGADEVRHALGVRRESMPPAESAFVGREDELATLKGAFERARQGVSVAALVHGASGIGKSALVERFVRGLDERPLVTFVGRCFEHESVPYTGMDAVVDALSSYLRTLTDADVRAMLPDDAGFLVRLFPVLAQVGELADAADRERLSDVDGVELRARAFFALRELFGAIARRSAVVVAIDDLQWGDADTAPLLRELLCAPGVLFLGSYRTDDVRTSPLLSRLLPIDGDVELVDLPLSPLRETELEALALAQLGPLPPEVAARIATEARGSAFFVQELVHWARGGSSLEGVDLTDVLRRRVDALDERERALLTVVCVAGRPLGRDLARRASGASGDPLPLVSALRRGGLLRSRRDVEGSVVLEPFHDLVRRAVTDGLASTRTRAVHASLAEAYAKETRPDEEALAWHWAAAGEVERAADHAVRAAEAAFGALAWERAVRLYRSALAWREPSGEERVRVHPHPRSRVGAAVSRNPAAPRTDVRSARHDSASIHERLGEALANAGWGSEAADAYGRARRAATGSERVDLWRREAQHLLTTGRVDEGYRALEGVLHEVGLELPSTRRALLEIMVARGKLALRGLDFTPRPTADIDETSLRRIDVCLSAGVAFSAMDSARGGALVARALFDALDAGEPHRVTRALCFVAAFLSARGTDMQKMSEELLRRADALAGTLDDPALRALAIGAASLRAFHLGDWARAFELGERSEALFRERCLGVGKERATLQAFDASALLMMGRFEEAGQRLPRLLADAQARGDHFAASNFCAGIPHTHWLVRDASEEGRRLVEEAAAHWTRRGYNVQHFFFAWALAQTDLYDGRGVVAVSRLLDAERQIAGTAIERMQSVRVFLHHLAGRVAVSIGEPPTRHVRALEREPRVDAAAWASAIRGAAAARVGDADRASRELNDAVAGFTSLGLRAWAIAARRANARVCGDVDGVERAEAALASLGVRNPPRFARCFVPVD